MTPGATQPPFVAECRAAFAANAERIEGLRPLTEDDANRSPPDGSWSVAQCLDHAIKGAEIYLPYMQAALARGRARGVTGRDVLGRGTFLGRLLIAALDPDRKKQRKLRAPRMFQPSDGRIDWPGLLHRSRAVHGELDAILDAAVGLDLDRIRHRSPVSVLIRLSLAQSLRVQAVHVDRHLRQAERVIETLGLRAAGSGNQSPSAC